MPKKPRHTAWQRDATERAVERVDALLEELDRRRIDPIQILEDSVREYDNVCGPLPQFQQHG